MFHRGKQVETKSFLSVGDGCTVDYYAAMRTFTFMCVWIPMILNGYKNMDKNVVEPLLGC